MPEIEWRRFMALFDEVSAEHVAKGAGSLLGKRVKFYTTMHSVLPIYVEGTSVGKKPQRLKAQETQPTI